MPIDLWSLTLFPEGHEPAPPRTLEPMGPEDSRWPPIPAQDYSNLPRQRIGLHQKGFDFMRLSHQGEGMTSNSQPLVDGYLAGEEQNRLVAAAPAGFRPNRNPDTRCRILIRAFFRIDHGGLETPVVIRLCELPDLRSCPPRL